MNSIYAKVKYRIILIITKNKNLFFFPITAIKIVCDFNIVSFGIIKLEITIMWNMKAKKK